MTLWKGRWATASATAHRPSETTAIALVKNRLAVGQRLQPDSYVTRASMPSAYVRTRPGLSAERDRVAREAFGLGRARPLMCAGNVLIKRGWLPAKLISAGRATRRLRRGPAHGEARQARSAYGCARRAFSAVILFPECRQDAVRDRRQQILQKCALALVDEDLCWHARH